MGMTGGARRARESRERDERRRKWLDSLPPDVRERVLERQAAYDRKVMRGAGVLVAFLIVMIGALLIYRHYRPDAFAHPSEPSPRRHHHMWSIP